MGRTKVRKPKEIPKARKKAVIVPRDEWGAVEPTSRVPLQLPVYNVMIKYYTDSPPCETKEECMDALRDLQFKYMQFGMSDIPYNFLIGGDDQIYEGRGWFTKPDKMDNEMPKWDGLSLDIAYIGQRKPGMNMTLACGDLMEMGIDKKCIVGMFAFEILTGIPEPPPVFTIEPYNSTC